MQPIKYLQGIIPICSYCKKNRNDQGDWQHLETIFADHSDAGFSHGVCPECHEQIVKPEMDAALKNFNENPFK